MLDLKNREFQANKELQVLIAEEFTLNYFHLYLFTIENTLFLSNFLHHRGH